MVCFLDVQCAPLVHEEKSTDIAYDCRGISGPTPTIVLAAANSSLQVSMTVLSWSKPISMLLIHIHCAQSVRITVSRQFLWSPSQIVQCGYEYNYLPRLFSLGTSITIDLHLHAPRLISP